ncbi:MAG TPA: ROK family protein [Steroidobacteraceae bacterium]|nr:ROK family protein [Steroidobacteraceae bacterium]
MAAALIMAAQNLVVGAVDIGGTKIAAGAIDASGKVLAKEVQATVPAAGFDAAMRRVTAMLESVRARAGAELCGIGIGCTGPVNPMTGEIGSVEFLAAWRGCNPVDWLSRHFGLKVAMENDADAAALGEWQWGAGRGKRHVICVTVGTGIGGGIVLNGALYRGVDGSHPEIGHHVIEASGPACYCGALGCWELFARGPAIAARFAHEAPPDYPHRERLTARGVCELARQGDALARRESEREGNYLGVGIANLITMFVPEVIALSGSVMNSVDLFMPTIRAVVRRNCALVPAASVELVPAALGNDAPLIGAGAVWTHRFGTH